MTFKDKRPLHNFRTFLKLKLQLYPHSIYIWVKLAFPQPRLNHNINRFRELGDISAQSYMAKNQHWRDLTGRWHHIKTEIQVLEIIAQIQNYIC